MKKNFSAFLSRNWQLLLFLGFWTVYFALFWSKAIFFDEQGNFWAGHVNIWGDWAAHFTMATAMAERGLFIKSPFLIGANFSYPFVADYISALLLNLGLPFIQAFTIPSFFFSLLIVWALYYFYRTFFISRKVAVVATCIFLFNGGLGFLQFIQDILISTEPLTTLLNPAHEYTRIDEMGIRWISVIDSMIIPQRSFALGFSCALIAIAMIYKIFFAKAKSQTWQLLLIGVLLGFLPILHTHSFLAAFIFLSWWVIVDLAFLSKAQQRVEHFKKWAVIVITTLAISVPLIKLFFLTNASHNFFHVQLGWMASEFGLNWFTFIWRNFGITPVLAVIAWIFFFQKAKTRLNALLFLPSFVIFGLSNLFLFQPWSWDNTKLLVWFLLGTSGLISAFLLHFAKSKWKFVAIVLFFVVTASGIIDAYRIERITLHSYQEYSSNEFVLANWVKTNTDKNSIWLTGHPHNHWLFNLTGRQTVLAYPGWLWTQGYNYLPVQNDVTQMYDGNQFSLDLLKKYGVNYAIIGPNEHTTDIHANRDFFDTNFKVVYQFNDTVIYKIY